jgi:hypothetical protein
MMAHCHCILLFYNTITKGDNSTLLSSSSFQTQRRQNNKKTTKKKPRKGRELTFKLPFYPFIFGSHFYLSVSNAFSWHLFLLKLKKTKQNKEKETIEKDKM